MKWTKTSTWLILIGVATCLLGIYIMDVGVHGATDTIPLIKAMITSYGLIGVFGATIIAGTVIPLGSPAIVACAAGFGIPIAQLIVVASVGYTVGVTINYYLARTMGTKYIERKVSREKLEGMVRRWKRWGILLLIIFGLVPGLPIDLLALVCGLLKTKIVHFLLISFSTRIIQFGAFALLGVTVGGWIGI